MSESPKVQKRKTPAKSLTRANLRRIKKLGEPWQLDLKQRKVTGQFVFPRHLDALMFLTRIAITAEVVQHYPELCLRENRVIVTLTTEPEKCVTEADVELAERITQFYPRSGQPKTL